MKFTDKKGREWTTEITFGDVKRLQNCGINLLEVGSEDAEDETTLFTTLMLDVEQMLVAVSTLIQPQLEAASVSVEDFLGSLTGKQIGDAREAFITGWLDFFLTSGSGIQAKAIQKQMDAFPKMVERMGKVLDDLDLNEAIEKRAEEASQELQERLNQSTSKSSG